MLNSVAEVGVDIAVIRAQRRYMISSHLAAARALARVNGGAESAPPLGMPTVVWTQHHCAKGNGPVESTGPLGGQTAGRTPHHRVGLNGGAESAPPLVMTHRHLCGPLSNGPGNDVSAGRVGHADSAGPCDALNESRTDLSESRFRWS